MNLTRDHITLVLGIELPLNESLDNLSENMRQRIILEQMIYENFIDSLKKYAGEKWNKVITTITDWKDAAVILGKVILDPTTLQNFSDNFWKTFKGGLLNRLFELLKKLKLDKFIPQIQNVIDKITNLTGWQKFLAATAIASITEYIVSKLSSLSPEGLTKWILAYFSEDAINTIKSKLTDFSSYVGWLQPIIKGTEILYNLLKPTINKFKLAFNLKLNTPTLTEMKKEILKQIIREEIAKLKTEVTLPANQAKSTTNQPPQKIQGAVLNIELLKKLSPDTNPTNITSAITAIKTNKSLTPIQNKTLADLMVSMIKTSDDALLNKIFQNFKSMEVK